MNSNDLYPSRKDDRFEIQDRQDPVAYCDPEHITGPLTQEQVEQYDRDGFLFFEGMFGENEVKTFLDELATLAADESIRGEECVITEPESGEVRSVFDVTQFNQVLFMLSRNHTLVEMVQQLLNDDVYIHQARVNFKPGFEGKEFYWHSDFETWHVEDGMPRMRAVSCSIALTENNEFNGPLMVVPGSHRKFVRCGGVTPSDNYKQSLKRQRYGVPDHDSMRQLVDACGITAPKGRAGSVLLFECNLMHGSAGNISPFPRNNLFFVYNSVTNQLVEPFSGMAPRPAHFANRSFIPITPVEVAPSYAAIPTA